ncbi:single Ig IL-1-related receptor precursor [Salmo salar]|uniref:Single Ig IL-1-related receptor precursor n=1 Tax=Salmo salar TaxID=8030 RepID=A0A1S2X7F6_SALSA|nr:single Ig IL-1-related receptor precursor [Salmo salar]ACN11332.1 Single Ig IL-1-related receptor [Salmo salar]|eukprot:NP_001167309.1 single Ig IL-1-related receptor precursor [Salmo salar]
MTSNQLAFILTCTLWNRMSVCAGESLCTQAPEFQLPSGGQSEVWETLGSFVALNCTAVLSWNETDQRCDATSWKLLWSKDGTPLNLSLYPQNTSTWTPSQSQMIVSSVLEVQVREQADFGLYSCEVRNTSADFSLQNTAHPSHTASVIAAISLFLILTIAAVVYSRCRLNIKLWYRNSYGDYEINDGKLHDAYFSYVNNEYDRKLVNFILKPHLVNKSGHKLHLSDNNILPGGEPSAEFLMNVSHCRRLIVVMSHAYLEQDWCCNNFRQGLLHLLELSQRPIIIITLEGQVKLMRPDVVQQLREHHHKLTLLTWSGSHSMPPSSVFWKELALAMPHRVVFHSDTAGDPQTLFQDDKDPMLTLDPDYLDCRPDPDPVGDLGLRLPVYTTLTSRAPVLPMFPSVPASLTEPKHSDIDVSDLGSRNYGARNDFYCLVTEDNI